MLLERTQIAVAWLVALVVCSCGLIALSPLNSPSSAAEYLSIGFLLGSLLGHSFLASAWIVLGPNSLKLRLPLAFVWGLSLSTAMLVNTFLYRQPSGVGVIYLSQIGIASLTILIAWLIRWRFGLRITNATTETVAQAEAWVATNQYGIQHLMVVTTLVAVAIAIGRVLVGSVLPWLQGGEALIFGFLVLAACLICVPTLFALLSVRLSWLSLGVQLVFWAMVTYLEVPLLRILSSSRGPDWLHFLLINLFTVFPVVVFAGTARVIGYRLTARRL